MLSLTVFCLTSLASYTPLQLANYLRGSWSLTKTMQYARGGKHGTFSGTAEFAELDCDDGRSRLSYCEAGEMVLLPEETRLSASKRLLYDFGGAQGDHDNSRVVKVFFDEAPSRSPGDVLRSAKYFHDIDMTSREEVPPFKHPCGPDMYTGGIAISDAEAFVMTWKVEGPRKVGTVVSRFRRC